MMSGDFAATMLLLDWPKTDQMNQQDWDNTFYALCDAAKQTGKNAIVLASMADCMPKRIIEECQKHGIAPMIGLDSCLKSLHHSYRCGQAFNAELSAPIEALIPVSKKTQTKRTLTEFDGKQLLAKHGISIPKSELVSSIEGALKVADKLNYPVAVKVSSETLVHKSDSGAVRVNVKDAEMLKLAVSELIQIGPSLLIEEMVEGALAELIIGSDCDPLFGKYLIIGSGGLLVELFTDSIPLLIPVERSNVLEALSELRLFPILEGYRGNPAADIDAVIDAVMSTVEFVKSNEVVELDINPLLVLPQGKGAIAVDAMVRLN
jgi:acetyl-CoA synthetase